VLWWHFLVSAPVSKENGQMAETDQLRCVHCGKTVTEMTKDHVFPDSWYPETTPDSTQRWTVPSCSACNNRLGSIEKKVFSRLALCIDPRKAEAAGLSAKVRCSLGIGVEGLGAVEAEHRRKQKLGLMAAIKPHESAASASILPGLGSHAGFEDKELPQIRIPADLLNTVADKIVRGCEYSLSGRIVEKPYRIQIFFAHDHNVPDVLARALKGPSAKKVRLGPGFSVVRIAAHDAPDSVVYKITLWGTLAFYAVILPSDESEIATPAN
jgi:hypothetical protein